jgi:uncharacterized protein (DUF2147 family)
MKKTVLLVITLLLISAACFAADPAEGFWLSVDEKTGKITAGWEIYLEGGKLYGKVLSTAGFPQDVKAEKCKESYKGFPVSGRVNQMNVVGSPWIFGLAKIKEGQWANGNVINPEDGNMYLCKITFHQRDGKKYKDDTLEMRGELALGIGRSQFWQKADRQAASAVR